VLIESFKWSMLPLAYPVDTLFFSLLRQLVCGKMDVSFWQKPF
jgi:hypothetical protein